MNRITNDPQRIEKRRQLLTPKQPCPDNCPCRQEDAMTTPLDIEDYQ